MPKLTIHDRITRHFDDFEMRFRVEFNQRKAEYGLKGLTGSSAMIKAGFAIFETELNEMLDRLLAEIAHVIRNRRRQWRVAHDLVRGRLRENYPDITWRIGAQLGSRSDFDHATWKYFGADITNAAIDKIDAHEAGFTSPLPDPIPVRFPLAYAAACGLLGFVGGSGASIFGEDIRAFTLDLVSTQHQSKPGGSVSPPTSPPPGADTPAA